MDNRAIRVAVREVRLNDAAAVAGVINGIIASGAPVAFADEVSLESERRYLADFPHRGVFHVAVLPDDVTVVGFQSMEPFALAPSAFDHVGVIGTYVAAEYRGRGIAAALFDATFAAARRTGFEKIMAFVRQDNAAGLAVYTKHGFRQVGIAARHAKVRGDYIDELILERFV